MNFPKLKRSFFFQVQQKLLVFFSGSGDHPNRWTNQRQPRYQGKETFSKVHFGGTDGQTGCLVVNPTESTTHYVRGKKYLWHGNGGIFAATKIMWNVRIIPPLDRSHTSHGGELEHHYITKLLQFGSCHQKLFKNNKHRQMRLIVITMLQSMTF